MTRDKVAKLYLSNKTQAQIGEIIGLTQQAVSLHIKALRARWLESADMDFSLLRAQELAKLDNLELITHEAWQESRIAKITKTVDVVSGSEIKKQTRTEAKHGDARFLDIIFKCVAKRCELLGVNAPTKIAATTPNGKHPAEGMGLVGLLQEADRLDAEDAAERLKAEEAADSESIQQRVYARVMDAVDKKD
ncbi:MAG: hypothetical protein P1U35_02900 [Cycloclasticus sp.]|nr:hypothetical protein [Cycloclasticus sp.]